MVVFSIYYRGQYAYVVLKVLYAIVSGHVFDDILEKDDVFLDNRGKRTEKTVVRKRLFPLLLQCTAMIMRNFVKLRETSGL